MHVGTATIHGFDITSFDKPARESKQQQCMTCVIHSSGQQQGTDSRLSKQGVEWCVLLADDSITRFDHSRRQLMLLSVKIAVHVPEADDAGQDAGVACAPCQCVARCIEAVVACSGASQLHGCWCTPVAAHLSVADPHHFYLHHKNSCHCFSH